MGVVLALGHVLESTHDHERAYFGLLALALNWLNYLYAYLLVPVRLRSIDENTKYSIEDNSLLQSGTTSRTDVHT